MSKESTQSTTEKQVSRRSMLKWTAGLAAAAVVGAGIGYGADKLLQPPPPPPISLKPPLSPEIKERVDAIKQQLINRHAGETFNFFVCNANGCQGVGPCIVKARIKNGVVTATENCDPLNKEYGPREAVPEDQLRKMMINNRPCVRGHMMRKTFYDPNHLKYPMKLVPGTLHNYVRISWDEALDTMYTNIKQVTEKRGPYSVVGGTIGLPFLDYIANYAVDTWGMSSWSGNQLADLITIGQQVWGKTPTGARVSDQNGPDDPTLLDAKLFVLFGFNAGANSLSQQLWINLAQEKGAQVIYIDPVHAINARLADQWIPMRPGTDMAMLAAMANVLFKENIYDKAFVDKFVEPNGFKMWQDYILGVTEGPDGKIDRTPEWAEKITGVPAETTKALTRLIVKTKPTYFRVHWVVMRQLYGENAARAAIYLSAMMGQMGLSGNYPAAADVQSKSWLPAPFENLKRTSPVPYQRLSMVYTRGWEQAANLRDDLDSGKIKEDEFRQKAGMAADWPMINPRLLEIKMGAFAGNHDQNFVWKAFRKADFAFAGITNMKQPHPGAKILLPLADYLDGLWRNWVGGYSRRPNHFMSGFKCLKRMGEAKDVEWINIQLAKRFGVAEKFSPRLLDVLDNEDAWDKRRLEIMKEGYDTWSQREDTKSYPKPTWEEFQKCPIYFVPLGRPLNISWDANINKGQPFETESGKIEFYSKFIASGDISKKSFSLPKRGDQRMCFGGSATPKIPPIAQWVTPINQNIGRDGAKYPLTVLTGGPRIARQHHGFDFNRWAQDEYRHAVWLSVSDAKARGVKDGDLVRIYNDNGEIVAPAYVTSRMMPGITHISFGAYPEFSQMRTTLSPEGIDMRGVSNLLTRNNPEGWVLGPVHCHDVAQVEKF